MCILRVRTLTTATACQIRMQDARLSTVSSLSGPRVPKRAWPGIPDSPCKASVQDWTPSWL